MKFGRVNPSIAAIVLVVVLAACSPGSRNSEELEGLKSENESLRQELKVALGKIQTLESKLQDFGSSIVPGNTSSGSIKSNAGWIVSKYVDEFGRETNQKFVTTADFFSGKFGNSATEDSPLRVRIFSNSETSIDLKLFPYRSNSPLKISGKRYFKLTVLDPSGEKTPLVGVAEDSDRISLIRYNAKGLHDLLSKGGKISVHIQDETNPHSEYFFVIPDSSGYKPMFEQMKSEG